MPINSKVSVRNVERHKKKVRRIPDNVAKRVAAAYEKNAEEFVQVARRDVPKRTGRLSQNIEHYAVEGTRGLLRRAYAGINAAAAYAKGYWAHFVEFGTVNAPAQPFFFVNLRAFSSRFKGRVTRAWRQGIRDSLK